MRFVSFICACIVAFGYLYLSYQITHYYWIHGRKAICLGLSAVSVVFIYFLVNTLQEVVWLC